MPPKKPKKQQQPDDQFMKMAANQLEYNLKLLKDKVGQLKSKRNYIQMDRDMVEQFYHNTELQIQQLHTDILNKEAQAENMTVEHNKQVKVFLQRLKLLEFQQQKSNMRIEDDGQKAKGQEDKYYDGRMKKMKGEKNELKQKQIDDEKIYFDKTKQLNEKHQKTQAYLHDDNDKDLQQTQKRYQTRLQSMIQQLQLKLKVDIHELEQRKNLHINELIKSHEQAFAQLKNYYNSITRDNLTLIKDHKAEIKQINEQSERNKKKIADLKVLNNSMKQPLQQARMEKDKLKSLLRQFQKHKMSLQNYKSKFSALRQKVIKIQKQLYELTQKYDKVATEKKQLNHKFQSLTKQVKKHAEMGNVVLTRKMQAQMEQLQQKQAQLHQLMQNSSLPPDSVQQIKLRVKQSIQTKNQQIKNLKYSINHATKAYNDAIRVYQAKLVQFGIPSQQLGFQPLPTITSSMPAGLVSS